MTEKEQSKLYYKTWYSKNRELKKKQCAEYYSNNKDKFSTYNKERYLNNEKEIKAKVQSYRKLNNGKVNALNKRYKLNKIQRTPKWANIDRIREIYELAATKTRLLGKCFHVDHIIPLQGKLVSGLHTESNLQIITAEQNSRKYNTFKILGF